MKIKSSGKLKNLKKTPSNIILTKSNQIVMEGKEICQIFSTPFTNVTNGLKLQ